MLPGLIRRHRKNAGSPWRRLSSGQQALLVLAYLRKGDTFAELAAGFGVGTSTAGRYVTETVGLLAARSPKLRRALRDAKKAEHAYVVIDGTLIPIDRVATDRPFYSGKHPRRSGKKDGCPGRDGALSTAPSPAARAGRRPPDPRETVPSAGPRRRPSRATSQRCGRHGSGRRTG